ncbi:MAG: hypothetical protein JXM68_06235 [Sedimentisphaerales bacterium]|nr:hypothetical protein [Sedimentisphaerales bacterium]
MVYTPKDEAKFIKPTVAVIGFENRVPSKVQSQVGNGMSEQLTERLISTKRYVVVERQYFNQILRELSNSKSDLFREQGRLKSGELKHVNYLIRGVITDYGHVETTQGILRLFDWGLFGPSSYVVVAANITVIDVQSGQNIASVSVEGKAKTTSQKGDMRDDSVPFGGHAFYKTTLGKATKKMLNDAVVKIADIIAEEKYRPTVARIDGNTIFIAGGDDRKIKQGQLYLVRDIPEPIIDPLTGDKLGDIPGRVIGQVEIKSVLQKYSVGRIISGYDYKIGQVLFNTEEEPALGLPDVNRFKNSKLDNSDIRPIETMD